MYYILLPAEISTNLARFDGVLYGVHKEGADLLQDYLQSRSEGFGPESIRRILIGTYVLSAGYIDAFYNKATAGRDVLREEYMDAFKDVDVIATPTTPSVAFKFGEKSDPVSMYLEDIYTVTSNLTGFLALSVPMGAVAEGALELPTGILLTAAYGGEERLFSVGAKITGETLD